MKGLIINSIPSTPKLLHIHSTRMFLFLQLEKCTGVHCGVGSNFRIPSILREPIDNIYIFILNSLG